MNKKLFKTLLCVCALTVFALPVAAAPYQNYTIVNTGGGAFSYVEPQAYVNTMVIDSRVIGLESLNNIPLNTPEDFVTVRDKQEIFIADTGNNRIIRLDYTYKVLQIIETFVNTEKGGADTFNAPTGLFVNADMQLYVCDTENSRIVRFSKDEEGLYQYDKAFNDPGISSYLGNNASPSANPDDTSNPATEAPAATDTPVPAETPIATETPAVTEAPTETPAPAETGTPGPEGTPGETTALETEAPTAAPTGAAQPDEQKYRPLKLVVDAGGRMFVVVKGCFWGLVELSPTGTFTKFMGATQTGATLDTFLRRFLPASMRKGLVDNLSTEYSNVFMDSDGLVLGTVANISVGELTGYLLGHNSGLGAPIRRLTVGGVDVLKRLGLQLNPGGDYANSGKREDLSYFVDVTAADDGIYSALDRNKGRVFTYNSNGDLLYVFGAKGRNEGAIDTPSAIDLLDYQTIAVLDSKLGQLTIYKPTKYGETIRLASLAQSNREYDKAIDLWQQVLGQSANSELAYSGIASVYYIRGDYKKSCEYYVLAYNQPGYSTAFAEYRDQVLKDILPYIMTVVIILAVGLIILFSTRSFRRFIKRKGRIDE